MRPVALILKAPGTNRDRDVLEAIELAGGEGEIVPLAALGSDACASFLKYGLLVIPGGFSYGDALGAGALLALDLRARFSEAIAAFVESGRPVLGICNGFQALVKSGVLPGPEFKGPPITLAHNASGRFECRSVRLAAPPSACLWTEGLGGEGSGPAFSCPVAHGEGRLASRDPEALAALKAGGRIALLYADAAGRPAGGAYPDNPNGSMGGVAGICNEAGNVLGLMPHPENAVRPRGGRAGGGGAAGLGGALRLFENGVRAAKAL